MATTQKELNASGCGTPNCGHDHSELYLHQRCHPGGKLSAKYTKATGSLTVMCAVCETPVAVIAVAEGHHEKAH